MSLKQNLFPAVAALCLAASPALADLPAGHTPSASLVDNFLKSAPAAAPLAPPILAIAGAGPVSADIALAGGGATPASSAAIDIAATVGTCEAYFTKSQSLTAVLQTALPAMGAKNAAAQAAVLPSLMAQLNSLPNTEVKAEICGSNHINAYTTAQYTDLNVLKVRGYSTGFPANLPIVKQPELNQVTLAYSAGWIKFEQQDFAGALIVFGKGLTMFPQSHELQNEYLATLIQLGQGQPTVDFADKVLNATFDLNDTERAKAYTARGVGLVLLNRLVEANDSLTIAQRYSYSEDVATMQVRIQAALPK